MTRKCQSPDGMTFNLTRQHWTSAAIMN